MGPACNPGTVTCKASDLVIFSAVKTIYTVYLYGMHHAECPVNAKKGERDVRQSRELTYYTPCTKVKRVFLLARSQYECLGSCDFLPNHHNGTVP